MKGYVCEMKSPFHVSSYYLHNNVVCLVIAFEAIFNFSVASVQNYLASTLDHILMQI